MLLTEKWEKKVGRIKVKFPTLRIFLHQFYVNKFQRLADILHTAAEDGGYVDLHKIEQILKVPNGKDSAATTTTAAEETVTGSYPLA